MENKIMVILAYFDGPGGCWPSHDLLAELLGIKRVTVLEHLKNIREKGFLSWKKRQRSNVYSLNYDNPAVRKFLTAETTEKNPAVRKFPRPAVRKFLTGTGIEQESIPPLPPRERGGRVRRRKQDTLDVTANAVVSLLNEKEE